MYEGMYIYVYPKSQLSGSWMTVEKWNVKQTERSKSCRCWKLCDSDKYSNFSLYFHALQVFQHLSDNWWGGWDHPSVQNWWQLGGTRLPGQLMTSNVSCVTKCLSFEALVESDWLFLYKGQIIHPDKLGPSNFSVSYIKMGRRQDMWIWTNKLMYIYCIMNGTIRQTWPRCII